MDEKLQGLLEKLFVSEHNTGCDGDLTVCSLDAVNKLKRYYNEHGGRVPQTEFITV
jgi:hypothetical protein